jgi:hypothetical protein
MAKDQYPLADMITALGMQLREAQQRHGASGESDLLKLKECTIELGVSWDKKADGGIDFWVIKLGGGVDKTNTQTVSVTLEPAGDATVALTE